MSVDQRHNSVTITEETGEVLHFGLSEYAAVRDTALQRSWCLLARFSRLPGRFPWLVESLHDGSATLLARSTFLQRGKAISGVEWRHGRKRAKCVDADSWGFSEVNRHADFCVPVEFLHALRGASDLVGVGDYDTPAALGTAVLHKAWQDQQLPRLWRLPRELRHWLAENPVRPRIYDVATDVTYPLLRECDRRSAYARALAGNLPLAQPCYVSKSEAARDLVRWSALCPNSQTQARPAQEQADDYLAYGLWRLEVPSPVFYGPVSRVWRQREKPSFHLQPGVYEVPLWSEEAAALSDCGVACTWLRGYVWTVVGAPFEEAISEITRLRESASPAVGEILKRLPNAAVGRFNCRETCTVIPEDQAGEGDLLFDLDDQGAYTPGQQSLAAVHVAADGACIPEHWYSYIVMRVALSIWREQRREMAAGYTVVGANIDSYRVLQPTLEFPPVGNAREWKQVLIRDAYVRASRSIDGWASVDHGETWIRLVRAPGVRRA